MLNFLNFYCDFYDDCYTAANDAEGPWGIEPIAVFEFEFTWNYLGKLTIVLGVFNYAVLAFGIIVDLFC